MSKKEFGMKKWDFQFPASAASMSVQMLGMESNQDLLTIAVKDGNWHDGETIRIQGAFERSEFLAAMRKIANDLEVPDTWLGLDKE